MLMPAPWVVVVLATRVYVPFMWSLRVHFLCDPPRNGCNFFKAVRSSVSTRLKAKKREIRQAGIQVAVDSTDHYTNEDVVLSSPSPRKREDTFTFRELNLDLIAVKRHLVSCELLRSIG